MTLSVDYLKQVQRGIDYIEARLNADLSPAAVARHAGMSQWHFQRIFRSLTGDTLKSYIRARRFGSALSRLRGTNDRVIEIALASGFDTQESFTRAFKKAFSVTPAHYRRHHTKLPMLQKLRIDAEYMQHLHGSVTPEPVIYVQRPMKLVGLTTRFFGVDSEKNNLAKKLPALWGAFVPRLSEVRGRVEPVCYGVVRQTPEMTDELSYHAVTEIDANAEAPPGMVTLSLPETRYARFTHRGKVGQVDLTVSYIYSSWLLRSGMRHTYAADLEVYGPRYHPESDTSEIDYAIPVEDSAAHR